MQENKELSRIDIMYQEDFTLSNIEKKYNKLIKLKVEPYINCIVFQYYLNELGGDHYTRGIISEIEKYIDKIDKNINIISSFKESDSTKEMLKKKKENANKIQKKIKKTYEDYIKKCQNDKECIKFNIYNFHLNQLETYKINNNKNENKDHLEKLKKDKKRVEDLLDNETEDIYQKLLESHIGVIEQQIEILR
jgi:exonuclease VII large subunit